MDHELIENLKTFGLSDYESKAYAALVSMGTGSVTEVSQLCDVPRSNLYAVLEKLNEKGFAEIQKGRPILFKALEPKKVFDELEETYVSRIKNAKKGALKKLEKIQGMKESDETPALVWGVRGYNSVLGKILEIIKRSKKEIFINIPSLDILDDRTYSELEKAKERGVKTRIACERKNKNIKKFQPVALIRTREKIHGVDVVVDEKEILIAPSFPIVAAWVDNPEFALHVKDFLNLVWKDSEVLK